MCRVLLRLQMRETLVFFVEADILPLFPAKTLQADREREKLRFDKKIRYAYRITKRWLWNDHRGQITTQIKDQLF
jgi:hypothetical protein